MINNQQNDLSLLRPFNLEAAKSGEEIISIFDENTPGVFVGMDATGTICIDRKHHGLSLWAKDEFNILRMKPLCWVENKPVYKGDVLYSKFFHQYKITEDGTFTVTGTDRCGQFTTFSGAATVPKSCSWNKPKQKVKKKIWINVYPGGETYSYPSKVIADYKADMESRIACVETEIEYEV